MKIACLQFAPQVGDINNNLNRADLALARANPDDLEGLDLLVLPELAFTGYNFKSLNQISPFLEPQGSGISALWARTTALKYNTNVIVGYPERVDVTSQWPTGPEYYSSSIVVNGDGETIANYRKSFLYVIDETWALEGKEGFFAGDIPQLGNTVMGICMDLNPYRFEAPWHAFEFAFHILAMEANLVIVTMAWVTREDGRHFSRMPEDPDMETLTYWVQRLEPIIRAENEDEVIVVFCNRTGTEGDLVYAGTSSVIGIKDGEVNVYGVLGRSVKDVLVVDTDRGPFAKLVQRTDREEDITSKASEYPRKPSISTPTRPPESTISTEQSIKSRKGQRKPSPKPSLSDKAKNTKPKSPTIHIPEYRNPDQYAVPVTPVEESPGVATPTYPSPTPFRERPNLVIPGATSTYQHVNTPFPHDEVRGVEDEEPQDKYFWRVDQPPLISPMESRFPETYSSAASTTAPPVALVSLGVRDTSVTRSSRLKAEVSLEDNSDECRHGSAKWRQDKDRDSEVEKDQVQDAAPPRPASPKSRNASRTGERQLERRSSMVAQPDLSSLTQRPETVARRPGSATDSRYDVGDEPRQERPRGPRSTSRMGRSSYASPQVLDDRSGHFSPTQIPYRASPSIFAEETVRPQSDIFKNHKHVRKASSASPHPLARDTSRNNSFTGTGRGELPPRSNSDARLNANSKPHIEPDETRTLVWSELSKMVGELLHQPETRDVSRGRHRNASFDTPMTNRTVQAEGSRPRVLPRTEQRFASQERRGPTPIRTIHAPDTTEGQSSPYNPDDEIVAEIIFHGRASQNQASSQAQSNGSTPSRATNPRSPPMAQKATTRQVDGHESSPRSRDATPQAGKKPSPMPAQRKRPSFHDSFGEIKVFKAPTPSNIKYRPGSNESCPNLDGASVRTLTTPKGSPGTPSLVFEPKTPKAMKFDPSLGILSSTSDPNPSGQFPLLDSVQNDVLGLEIPTAKSTM